MKNKDNSLLSLEGDTTIHATKADGVLTRVDEAPSKGIVKDLDCYGNWLKHIGSFREYIHNK